MPSDVDRPKRARWLSLQSGPARTLAAWYAIDGIGTSMWVAISALYLTQSVGLSLATVGVGLAVAGLVGMTLSVPIGRLADRRGLRRTALVLTAGQGIAMACYALLGHGLPTWAFAPIACIFMICQRAGNSTRNGLLAVLVTGSERLGVRATCRSIATAAGAIGALLTLPILAASSRPAYLIAIGVNAASYALALVAVSRLPRDRPTVPGPPRGWGALKNGKYVAAAGLVGLLSIHNSLLLIGLPLWISLYTDVSHVLVSVVVVTNTLVVVVGQVPLSRGVDGIPSATSALRRSGVLLGVACLAVAASNAFSTLWAVATIVAAVGVLTVGEILQSAGGWALSYDLAPEDAHGEYQAVYSLGNGVRDTLGPLVATTAVAVGPWGWAATAVMLAAIGSVFTVIHWAPPG